MKTAIEQLIEELSNGFLENKFNNSSDILNLCREYKKLEKRQIIDTAVEFGMHGEEMMRERGEEYYNLTFKL